ncbi:hypothetical protein M9H77_08010 [Catharanthus roseus]|uniref:Tabersonine 6,7-epoxidase isoform 1 n=2 Tax=Catharanthus roseus TaxID=4058 RepID=TEX1_CATRO|nr:RecName: Full=Tabersonine 6,7-epoxidase isoform 1; AltName: Full=Cytochrome P450 71D521 [Catharanthus roseus]AVH80640.1 tabersonine 6,7-epoxidase isoform 1 [Catharanthus roseus]KAI5677060.1 hypothetical protein M9H77_08010 [Catharanthus roseus]
MEFVVSLFAFVVSCFILLKVAKNSKNPKRNTNLELPPGPKQLPIIGNLHQLGGGLAHHVLRNLGKQYGPLMHLKIGELSTIVVSSTEIAKEVFKTHDIHFSNRPSHILVFKIVSYDYKDIVLSQYGKYWRELRKVCNLELLSPNRVQSFRSIREDAVLNMMKSISSNDGKVVNLSEMILSLIYGITARAAFGVWSKKHEEFIRLESEIQRLATTFVLADMFPSIKFLGALSGLRYKVEKVHKKVDDILEGILKEHRRQNNNMTEENGKKDLVDVLLNIQKNGDMETPFTDQHIKAIIFDMFSAGTLTSTIAVDWAMAEMMKNPSVLKRAQDEVRNVYNGIGNVDESKLDELKYLQAVIKETLRIHPGTPIVHRETREECEINGYRIPAKARVMVNAWAISRDPNYWPEPDIFKPERFLGSEVDFKGTHFEYIPFGAGRRICPGISYAIANVQLPLAQLLYHFEWKLPGGMKPEELDMTEILGTAAQRKENLLLIPNSHSCSSLKQV